jgi:hypothetical protein
MNMHRKSATMLASVMTMIHALPDSRQPIHDINDLKAKLPKYFGE